MSKKIYIPDLGYAIKHQGRWVVLGPGGSKSIMPLDISPDDLRRAFLDSIGNPKLGKIFDYPGAHSYVRSGARSQDIGAGVTVNVFIINVSKTEVCLFKNLAILNGNVLAQVFADGDLTVAFTAAGQLILQVNGAAIGTVSNAFMEVRKDYHGEKEIRLDITNNTLGALNVTSVWNAWVVPEEVV